MQRTGTEICKDCNQQNRNLYRYLLRYLSETELDNLSTRVNLKYSRISRYYWKVMWTTDVEEVIRSDVQFF